MSIQSIEQALSIMRICYKLEGNINQSSIISFEYKSFNIILHFTAENYSKIEFILLDEADKKIPTFIWKNLIKSCFKVTKKKTIIGHSIATMNKTIDGTRAAEDSLTTSINLFEEKLLKARSIYAEFKDSLMHADGWMEKQFKRNYSPYNSFNMSKYSTFVDMNKETYMTMFNTEIKEFIDFKLIIITIDDTHMKVKTFKNNNQSFLEVSDDVKIENTELKNYVDRIIEKFVVFEIDTIPKAEEEEEKNKSSMMIGINSYHPVVEINANSEFYR